MPLQALLQQLCRIFGRPAVLTALRKEPERVTALTPTQRTRLERLICDRQEALLTALIEEAAASDDVTDRESGLLYARSRLQNLSPFIVEPLQEKLLQAFTERTSEWG